MRLSRINSGDRVHIRLVDMANLPDRLRTQSESLAVGIFAKAGVEIDFVACPCRQAVGPGDFFLQILNQPLRHLHGDSAGFAVLVPSDRRADSYAAVSLPMVESAARELDVPVAEMLAASMAHEIGHLLLHSATHSRTGIMRPRVDAKQIRLLEQGNLGFNQDEVVRLVDWDLAR